jgi:hypothetical protein
MFFLLGQAGALGGPPQALVRILVHDGNLMSSADHKYETINGPLWFQMVAGATAHTRTRISPQLGARSRPYLSTLQPHFRHVHPPHIASSEDIGLRIIGSRSPPRGQEVPPKDPMPRRLFVLDCLRRNMKPASRTAAPSSMSQLAGSIGFSTMAWVTATD